MQEHLLYILMYILMFYSKFIVHWLE